MPLWKLNRKNILHQFSCVFVNDREKIYYHPFCWYYECSCLQMFPTFYCCGPHSTVYYIDHHVYIVHSFNLIEWLSECSWAHERTWQLLNMIGPVWGTWNAAPCRIGTPLYGCACRFLSFVLLCLFSFFTLSLKWKDKGMKAVIKMLQFDLGNAFFHKVNKTDGCV